jgi:hypothetical protein
MIIDNTLKLLITDMEISRDEAVSGMLSGHYHEKYDKIQECFKQYEKYDRLVRLGYQMLLDGNLEDWDWKWAADTGYLCDMDWEWFKEDLEKAGINREEFEKKWKAG